MIPASRCRSGATGNPCPTNPSVCSAQELNETDVSQVFGQPYWVQQNPWAPPNQYTPKANAAGSQQGFAAQVRSFVDSANSFAASVQQNVTASAQNFAAPTYPAPTFTAPEYAAPTYNLFTQPTNPHSPAPRDVECTACTDRIHPDQALKAPCGHYYCQGCLENLYYSCMTDEQLFPPRCCHKDFSWDLAKHHLSQRCRSMFGVKRIEFETKDRVYCHIPTCSAFIPPAEYTGRYAYCEGCNEITCVECKGPGHVSSRCPVDPTLDALLQTAQENEWKRCYGCGRMVGHKYGCYKMT